MRKIEGLKIALISPRSVAAKHMIRRVQPTLVSIKPHDIPDIDLKELVENTNKKLNFKSSQKRQATRDKYKLLRGSVHGDRKYLDPSSAQIEIYKKIIPINEILSNEGTHGTESRVPVRAQTTKRGNNH